MQYENKTKEELQRMLQTYKEKGLKDDVAAVETALAQLEELDNEAANAAAEPSGLATQEDLDNAAKIKAASEEANKVE